MKKIIKSFSIALAVILLTSCVNNKHGEKHSKKKAVNKIVEVAVDTSVIADKNFVFKNLKNTLDVKLIAKRLVSGGVDRHLYTDSSFKIAYTELSPYQKKRLIAPFISQELKVNDKYATELMAAYFVAKQDKIGDLQPIVICITGDDYSSLTMILLNKNNVPVNGFNLSGGQLSGPNEIGDSLISYNAKSYSFINRNKITSIKTEETDYTDSLKKDVTIDSNVFNILINNSGKILTKQIVKTRYVSKAKN